MGKKKLKTIWAAFVKIGLKFLSVLAKFAKATKFLKFGLAAASFAGYAMLFTWKFALLIMIALAWHESGHVLAMKAAGIKTKGFYFIPFLGGAAIAEERFKTYIENIFVAIAGPFAGLTLALVSYVIFSITGSPLFASAACWMALLNLFNLFPIMPLDGGQIVKAIAFSINKKIGFVFLFLSLIASIFLTVKFKLALLGIFIFIGMIDIIQYVVSQIRSQKIQDRYKTVYGDNWKKEYKDDGWEEQEAYVIGPNMLSIKELVLSISATLLTVLSLIAVMKATQHIPGASVAANFLADKSITHD